MSELSAVTGSFTVSGSPRLSESPSHAVKVTAMPAASAAFLLDLTGAMDVVLTFDSSGRRIVQICQFIVASDVR